MLIELHTLEEMITSIRKDVLHQDILYVLAGIDKNDGSSYLDQYELEVGFSHREYDEYMRLINVLKDEFETFCYQKLFCDQEFVIKYIFEYTEFHNLPISFVRRFSEKLSKYFDGTDSTGILENIYC